MRNLTTNILPPRHVQGQIRIQSNVTLSTLCPFSLHDQNESIVQQRIYPCVIIKARCGFKMVL